jgi:hypothetical protein
LPGVIGGANIHLDRSERRRQRRAAPYPAATNRSIGGNAMINRRTFTALLAGTVAAPQSAWSQPVTKKTVFYASVGPELALFDIDVADAALQKRSTVTLPANIQYAWPHPSKQYFYVVSSNGGPGSFPATSTWQTRSGSIRPPAH